MKCNFLKAKQLHYITFSITLGISLTSNLYAAASWSEDEDKIFHGTVHESDDEAGAFAPTTCPQLTPEDILKYVNDPTTAAKFNKNWQVIRTNITVTNLKEGEIFSPKVECLENGRRHILYKVKIGNQYHDQEAIVTPRKKVTKH